jgi:hypothetical protein
MNLRSDSAVLLRVMLPLLIWFVCLSLIYGVATLTCGQGPLAVTGRYLSIAISAAAVVGLGTAASFRIESRPFLTVVTRGLSFLAILAVGWLMAALLILEE